MLWTNFEENVNKHFEAERQAERRKVLGNKETPHLRSGRENNSPALKVPRRNTPVILVKVS
jgi:hypothetical protein